MTKIRKPIAIAMIMLMMISCMPSVVFADEITEQEVIAETIIEEQEQPDQEEETMTNEASLPEEKAMNPVEEPPEEIEPEINEYPDEAEAEENEEEVLGAITEDDETNAEPEEESAESIDEPKPMDEIVQEDETPAKETASDPETEDKEILSEEEEMPDEELPEKKTEEQEEKSEPEKEITENEEPVPCRLTVTLMDVRDDIIIRKNGETAASVFGNYAPGSGSYYLVGPTRLEAMAADPDGCTRLYFDALTGDIFSVEAFEQTYAKIYYSSEAACDTGNANGYAYCCLMMEGDAEVIVNGDYSAAKGYFAVGGMRSALKARADSWSPPDALYVSLGYCYSDYSSTAIVNGHTGVYFFQPEDQGEGHFISATCGSTTKHMQSGVHYKVARIAELAARPYLDYGSGCCSQRAQRALAWITHHGQSEYDWRRYNENRFVMGDNTIWVANQLEAYTITFLAAWVCTNDGRAGSYGTVHAEDGAHALDFMFGSSFSTGLPASTKSAIDTMVSKALAFADAHPNQDENITEYQGTFVYSDGDGSHQPLLIGAFQGERNGSVKVTKKSSLPSYTNGNAMYSLEGTTFRVTDSDGNTVGTLTADASGNTSSLELPAGTYTVTETKVGKGYILNKTEKKVTVNAGESKTVSFENKPVSDPATLYLRKWDRENDSAVPQGAATLQGARYRFDYYDNTSWSGTPKASWTFETNSDGIIRYLPEFKVSGPDLYINNGSYVLPLGSLKITEVRAPEGYVMSTDVLYATITQNGDIGRFQWTTETQNLIKAYGDSWVLLEDVIRGGVRFKKVDAETSKPVSGAEISIYSDTGEVYEKANRDLLIATLVTGEDGTCETAADLLPYGSYYAVETKASEGYLLNEEWGIDFDITENRKIVDLTSSGTVLKEQIIRGDLSMLKLDIDGNYKPNIPFMIVQIGEDGEEGEWHVIVTDEYGKIDTSAASRPHTSNTNSLDQYVDGGVFTDTSKLDPAVGVWFGDSEPVNDLGALPYGNYKVYELQTEQLAAEQVNILESKIIEIREPDRTITLSPMVNLNIELKSEASSEQGKDFIPAAAVKVVDTVYYTNLTSNRRYTMETQFVLKSTSEVLASVITDFYPPEGESGTSTAKGSVTLEAEIDVSEHSGDLVVACDYLYEYVKGTKVMIASHADLEDKAQTLRIPAIRTTARDSGTGDNIGTVSGSARIIDTVQYSNLRRGEVFMLVYKCGDSETGEPIKSEDGSDVYVEKRFVCSSESGSIEMPAFEVVSREYAGRSVVALEELYWIDEDHDNEEILMASHVSYDDEDQTITYPDIHTSATDSQTGSHVGVVSEDSILKDEVQLSGLITGKEYTVSGTLVYQEEFADRDHKLHRAGEPVPVKEGSETSVSFTADADEMTVTLTYIVDSTVLEGHATVVFEDLIHNGVPVASHADLTDEEQTVWYPSLKTRATDKTSGTSFVTRGTEVIFEDTADCDNLVIGETYIIHGKLMDKETRSELGYTAQSEVFTASQKDETVTIEFAVNTEKLGSGIIVVFEDLYLVQEDGSEILVIKHEDLDYEEQSLYYPGIRTTAVNSETNTHEAQGKEKVILKDTVTYKNLKPGEEYTVIGILMDKATGNPIVIDGERVTSRATFVPDEKDGHITLFFEFDGTGLVGKTAVVFERLICEGVEIAVHADIEDEEQSVNIVDIRTSAVDAETKTHKAGWNHVAKIVDTVTYTGLTPGKTYTVYGTMMAKGTGGVLYQNDAPVTGMTEFVPEEADGTVEVVFTIDTYTLQGLDLVVFERLFAGSVADDYLKSDVPITVHEDLNDEEQTISVPVMPRVPVNTGADDHLGLRLSLFVVSGAGLLWILKRKKQ